MMLSWICYCIFLLSELFSPSDLGKAAYRKENGSVAHPGPSSTLIYRVKLKNEQPSSNKLVLLRIQVN